MVAKDTFPFATMTDDCKKAIVWYFPMKLKKKNGNFNEKFHEINLFASVGHGCKGENILCNHESWLPSRYK